MGRPDSALAFAERAAAAWENERTVPLDPEWRERHGETGRKIFIHLAALLLEGGQSGTGDPAAAAFDRLQVYKARTLLERISGPGRTAQILEERRNEPPVTLEELQSGAIEDGELLLDFYLGPVESFLFAVTKKDLRVLPLPPSEEIGRKLTGYHELLASPGLTDEAILVEVGGALAKTLLAGTEGLLKGKSRILVAPDGPVNLLPLAELVPSTSGAREWARVPSATILARLRERRGEKERSRPVRVLALSSDPGAGDGPLAGAEAEVRRLASLYAGARKAIPAEGDALPPLDRWRDYDVLHFGAHARVDDPSPWQSEILLHSVGGGKNPRAAAIAAMDLPVRLVFLSSCRSAAGPYVSGEGILGLSNAFISAGAQAVVASLWAVDDGAAARFVDRFYKALAGGRTAAAALQEARASLRADPETDHPFHWSAFVLIGDGDVRVDLRKRTNPALYAAPTAVLAAIAALLLILPARATRNSRRRSGTSVAE